MHKKILNPHRIRRAQKGFSFIPHRFLGDGFLASLRKGEILLYLFLVLASDRYGISFYSDSTIIRLLKLTDEEYLLARGGLITKDLIAFDGALFQVLELPMKPVRDLGARNEHSVIGQCHSIATKKEGPMG